MESLDHRPPQPLIWAAAVNDANTILAMREELLSLGPGACAAGLTIGRPAGASDAVVEGRGCGGMRRSDLMLSHQARVGLALRWRCSRVRRGR